MCLRTSGRGLGYCRDDDSTCVRVSGRRTEPETVVDLVWYDDGGRACTRVSTCGLGLRVVMSWGRLYVGWVTWRCRRSCVLVRYQGDSDGVYLRNRLWWIVSEYRSPGPCGVWEVPSSNDESWPDLLFRSPGHGRGITMLYVRSSRLNLEPGILETLCFVNWLGRNMVLF